MAARLLKLEFPFGVRVDRFHCPMCGRRIMDETQFAEKPCRHLAFAYLDELGEFPFVAKRLEEDAETAMEADDPVKEISRKLGKGASVVFALTTGGMACGPTWSTTVLGFDFSVGRDRR